MVFKKENNQFQRKYPKSYLKENNLKIEHLKNDQKEI